MMTLRKISILIVEDHRPSTAAFKRMLQSQGHHVHHAPTLKEAQRVLEMFIPDVVILCLELPDGSGTSLFSQLRRPEYHWTQVIALTSNPFAREHVYASYEVSCVLVHPVHPRGLALLVNTLGRTTDAALARSPRTRRQRSEPITRAVPRLANVL